MEIVEKIINIEYFNGHFCSFLILVEFPNLQLE